MKTEKIMIQKTQYKITERHTKYIKKKKGIPECIKIHIFSLALFSHTIYETKWIHHLETKAIEKYILN